MCHGGHGAPCAVVAAQLVRQEGVGALGQWGEGSLGKAGQRRGVGREEMRPEDYDNFRFILFI